MSVGSWVSDLYPVGGKMRGGHLRLTDVVVEAQKRAAELCRRWASVIELLPPHLLGLYIPLSPFMMTHILDPTHLSTSSAFHVSAVSGRLPC